MPNNSPHDKRYLTTATQAAREAGALLKKHFETSDFAQISYKDPHSIVTVSDKASERIILQTLKAAFPDHSYFSEETGADGRSSDYYWVIDPLDGTTNFSRNIPAFCVSIALLYQRKPLLGVIYQPVTDQLFVAQIGQGATVNGEIIGIGKQDDLAKTVIALSRGGVLIEKLRCAAIFTAVTPKVRSIRLLGGTAMDLCYVAMGSLDAVISTGCYLYDCAAGNIIASEAGALLTDFQGKPFDWSKDVSDVLVTNPNLNRELVGVLQSH